jgi:hypothetical protein
MAAKFKHNIAAINLWISSQRTTTIAALKTYEIRDASCSSDASHISIAYRSSDAQWQRMSRTLQSSTKRINKSYCADFNNSVVE